MKEHWSVGEEKLLGLEGGLGLKDIPRDECRNGRNSFYKGVIRCMKLVLYVELILFVGWAGYTTWQTYGARWKDFRRTNVTEPHNAEIFSEGTQRSSIEENQAGKIVSEDVFDWTKENEKSVNVDSSTTQIPIVQSVNTESGQSVEADIDKLQSSDSSESPNTVENSKDTVQTVGNAEETTNTEVPQFIGWSFYGVTLDPNDWDDEPEEDQLHLYHFPTQEDPDEIIFPPTPTIDEDEHLELLTPLNFFWSSEEDGPPLSFDDDGINFNNEEVEEVEAQSEETPIKRSWESENPMQLEGESDEFIEGTLLRYRSGKFEKCQYDHIVNVMYALRCETLEQPLHVLAPILLRSYSKPYVDPFLIWDDETETVDIYFLHRYTSDFSIAIPASQKEVDYDAEADLFKWKIYRLNTATMDEELCLIKSLIPFYLKNTEFCVPVQYLRNSKFLTIPLIRTKFLLYNGIPDATMACPGNAESLYWSIEGCLPVGEISLISYFLNISSSDRSDPEEESEYSPGEQNPKMDDTFTTTTDTYNGWTSEDMIMENDLKTTEQTSVEYEELSDFKTDSENVNTSNDNSELSSEATPVDITESYYLDDDYLRDDASNYPYSSNYLLGVGYLSETDNLENESTTTDDDLTKNDYQPSWPDEFSMDSSPNTEDDYDRESSLYFGGQMGYFRRRRSVDERDISMVEIPGTPEEDGQNKEEKIETDVPTQLPEKKKLEDAGYKTENEEDDERLRKIRERYYALLYSHCRYGRYFSHFPRYTHPPFICNFDRPQHFLFRRSTTTGRKISNEIGDDKTSKEEFYDRVRAKVASQSLEKARKAPITGTVEKYEKFEDKMANLAAHIDRLHKRYLEKMELNDDYISNEFPLDESA